MPFERMSCIELKKCESFLLDSSFLINQSKDMDKESAAHFFSTAIF